MNDISRNWPLGKMLLAAIAVVLATAAQAADPDDLDQEIIGQCWLAQGVFGSNVVNDCVALERQARAAVEDYPLSAQRDCMDVFKAFGWRGVLRCIQADTAEAEHAMTMLAPPPKPKKAPR